MADELDMNELFSFDDGSTVDLSSMDVGDITADFGASSLPTGKYVFKCTADDIPRIVVSTKAGEDGSVIKTKKLVETYTVVAPVETEDEMSMDDVQRLIGRKHFERSFPLPTRVDLLDAIARMKGRAVKMGIVEEHEKITLGQLLERFASAQFVASVITRPSKKDPQYTNSNLVTKSIEPYTGEAIPA